jgi:WD40 repeat protein
VESGNLCLWEVATGKKLRTFSEAKLTTSALAFSPDGKVALSGSWDKTVRLWDVATGKELCSYLTNQPINSIAFSPNGKQVLAGGQKALLWDIATGKEVRTFQPRDGASWAGFLPDGKRILTSGGGVATLWNSSTGEAVRTFRWSAGGGDQVALSPDGKHAFFYYSAALVLWDLDVNQEVGVWASLEMRMRPFHCLAFSPDGKRAVSTSKDEPTTFWDVATGACSFTVPCNEPPEEYGAAWSPDGKQVLLGDTKGLVLWDVQARKEVRSFKIAEDLGWYVPPLCVAFSPDGKLALAGGYGHHRTQFGRLQLWEVASGKRVRTFEGQAAEVHFAALLPGGKRVLSADAKGTLILWDVASGKQVNAWTDPEAPRVALSPNGKRALRYGTKLKLWDVAAGKVAAVLVDDSSGVRGAAFSPNGKHVLWHESVSSMKVIDLRSGKQIGKAPRLGTLAGIWVPVFAPDGRLVWFDPYRPRLQLYEPVKYQAIPKD